jgi:ubiquinone/menaquinone biosynthesis C-methylase UbiE
MEKLKKALGSISGGKVLDIATGRGEFIGFLSQSLKDYDSFTGVDNCDSVFSQTLVKEDELPVSYKKMNAEKLEFDNEAFDTVALANSLHHLENLDSVFLEIKRVLKPGGNLIIREMYRDGHQSEARKNHIMFHHWCAGIDRILGIPHNDTLTKKELCSVIRALDMSRLDFIGISYPVKNARESILTERMIAVIDPYVERIREYPEYEEYKEEGEVIKLRLHEYGYAPAAGIFAIGKN